MTQAHWTDQMAEAVAQAYPDEPKPLTLGGLIVPAERDGQCWHDLAMKRARAEGIPVPSPHGAATSVLGAK